MWVSRSLLLQGAHQQACVSRSDIAGGGVFISNTFVGRTCTMGQGVHERKTAKTFLVAGCSSVSVSGPLLVAGCSSANLCQVRTLLTTRCSRANLGQGVNAAGWSSANLHQCQTRLLPWDDVPDVTIASTLSLQLF